MCRAVSLCCMSPGAPLKVNGSARDIRGRLGGWWDMINTTLWFPWAFWHYNDVLMSSMASRITSLKIVYLTVYWGADQRNYQSSVSLAFVRGIYRWPVNSPRKGPVTRKMFPFDDIIMTWPRRPYGTIWGHHLTSYSCIQSFAFRCVPPWRQYCHKICG